VIIVEPALRETARALHELRDDILRAGAGHVFAPCTRTGAPCPMLAHADDWCHEDRALALPPRTAELARVTHLRDSGMKFSYLVLRHSPLPLVDTTHAWRVVSAPFAPKGKLELFGCSDTGRVPLRLLKRNRSEANRAFERARRGDVVVLSPAADPTSGLRPPEDSPRIEIERDTRVDRVQPAGEPER
jgi:ribosomal protein RSM22 (predicted rRNA methylase)